MGRELKRKQAKRDGRNVKEVQKKKQDIENNTVTLNKLIILVIFIVLFFCVLYLITGLFITKDIKLSGKSNSTSEETTITNKILAKESLKQSEEVYYVYFYDPDKEDNGASNVANSLEDKVYRVDLSSDFNSDYVGEASGVVKNIEDLKVSNPTIIKIESGEMVAFYSGTSEIEKLS